MPRKHMDAGVHALLIISINSKFFGVLKITGKCDKTLISLNAQYILHLKKHTHLKQRFLPNLCIVLFNYDNFSLNHNVDMTIMN